MGNCLSSRPAISKPPGLDVIVENVVAPRASVLNIFRPETPEQPVQTRPLKKMGKVDFDKFIESLYMNILKADNKTHRNAIIDLDNYVNQTDDGFELKTMPFIIGGKNVDIPLYALVHHSQLDIEKVRLSLKIGIDASNIEEYNTKPTVDGKFAIQVVPGGDAATIEIEFAKVGPAPALERIEELMRIK